MGEPNGGALGKRPRKGPVESGRGVSGGKAQARISPKGSFDCLLGESIAILAGSEVQEAAPSDFQQIGQLNILRRKFRGVKDFSIFSL